MEFLKLAGLFSTIQFVRYLIFAGLVYLIFWSFKNKFTEKNRIQKIDFKKSDLFRELAYSLQTSLIFGITLSAGFYAQKDNLFNLTLQAPILESVLWLVFLILFHDTYFYWMHRTLHHPRLFSWTHKVHHLSKNPSPFAAMSFQPLEAFLEIVWIVPLAYFLPIEMGVWFIFSLVIILINVLGHLGVEIYPESWKQNQILKYLNTSTNHNEHHQYFHGNYSLYFSAWDRWMGTFRK